MGPMLQEWTEPPAMSRNAPAPAVFSTDGTLYVSYRIARDAQHCAVVCFNRVVEFAWGAPPAAHGDDIPGDLPRGSFYEVVTGDAGAKLAERRWIITFPDALLDVRAAEGEVVLRATAVLDPSHAIAALLA